MTNLIIRLPRVHPSSPPASLKKRKKGSAKREGGGECLGDSRKRYNGGMSGSQLPLFQRKTYKGILPTIPVDMQAPRADKTVLETLPAYYTYLTGDSRSRPCASKQPKLMRSNSAEEMDIGRSADHATRYSSDRSKTRGSSQNRPFVQNLG